MSAVVATVLGVFAAPAHAVTNLQTRIHLVKTKSVYKYGNKIAIRGWVQVYDPANCPSGHSWCTAPDTDGGSITITRHIWGTSGSSAVANRTNEADFSASDASRGATTYTVSYNGGNWGSTVHFNAATFSRAIHGSRNTHTSVVKSGGKLWIRGTVSPSWKHRAVTIQKKSCSSCGWHNYRTIQTNSNSYYVTRIGAPRTGKWWWRATVAPNKPRFVRAYSSAWYTYRG